MLEVREDYKPGPLVAVFSSQNIFSRERKVFEWEKTTEGKNRILFCDTEGLWYQKCVDEVIERLKEPTDLTIGCSKGGYAALLFAHLLGCKSLSFSPQTVLEDARWPGIEKAKALSRYPDLSFIHGKQHDIYYCKYNPGDVFHAERLNVSHHPVECVTHAVAKEIREQLACLIPD